MPRKLGVLLLFIPLLTCTVEVIDVPPFDAEPREEAGAMAPLDPNDIPPPLTEADITGLPTDPLDGMSAYQRGQVEKKIQISATRDAGVLVARMGVSEA